MTQTSGSQFVNSPVVFPQAAGPPQEHWKTRWRRLRNAGVNINKDHFVIGREVDGRWIGIVK